MFEFKEIFTEIHRCFVILRSTGRSLSIHPPLIGITMKISGVLCLKLRNVILNQTFVPCRLHKFKRKTNYKCLIYIHITNLFENNFSKQR